MRSIINSKKSKKYNKYRNWLIWIDFIDMKNHCDTLFYGIHTLELMLN